VRALALGGATWDEGRLALSGCDDVHDFKKEELRRELLSFSARKLNWNYHPNLLVTCKQVVADYRKLSAEAKIHGVTADLNLGEKLANELSNIPNNAIDSACCAFSRHFIKRLRDELREESAFGIPSDNALRNIFKKYESEVCQSETPLPKPTGNALMPSDKEANATLAAEVEKLRRELSQSRSAKQTVKKNVHASKAEVTDVPPPGGSKPCPVCKLEGHSVNECTSTLFVAGKDEKVLKSFKCWSCDKHGHRRAECPTAPAKPIKTVQASAAGTIPPATSSATVPPPTSGPLNGLTSSVNPSPGGVGNP